MGMANARALLVLLLAFLLGACSGSSSSGLRPAQLQSSYPELTHRQLSERLVETPPLLLEDLKAMDSESTYRSYTLSEEERNLVLKTLGGLPAPLMSTLEREVLALCFVENFLGGGMTHFVWKDGEPKFILIFNPQTLKLSLSDWLTFRDQSAFDAADPRYRVREVASGAHAGFLHTLIHEAYHVYDFSNLISQTRDQELTALAKQTWLNEKTPLPERDFPTRSRLSFYGFERKPKVPVADFLADFPRFQSAGFASIYGSGNSMDDYAERETYALLDREYSVRLTLEILDQGEVIAAFSPSNGLDVWEAR